jgi:hypothetical protein
VGIVDVNQQKCHAGDDFSRALDAANQSRKKTEAAAVAFVASRAIGLDTGTAATDYNPLYYACVYRIVRSISRHLEVRILARVQVLARCDDSRESCMF